ncbi:MAG TPA: FAD-dependent oxidoreductase [Mycobacteriales bacterium]|nr:FAD-dependent oxidoreductase [Mycobacteriales bacterium]
MTGAAACDVAVIGAGAAGLRAAAAAARAGAATVLIDSSERAGGQYFRQPAAPGRARSAVQASGHRLIEAALAAGVEFRPGTSVWDATVRDPSGWDATVRDSTGWDPTGLDLTAGELQLAAGGRLGSLGFRALVVATGAYERVAAFPGWTLSGVYTAGAVQTLLKEHGVLAGQRVLFAGSGPLQVVVAAELSRRGVAVAGVLEATRLLSEGARRPWRSGSGLWRQGGRIREGALGVARLRRARVPVRTGWGIVRATGAGQVDGAVVARLDRQWRPIAGSARTIRCDTIATGYSLVPAIDVLRLIGAELAHRPDLGGWVPRCGGSPRTSVPGVFAAGDCTGIGGVGMSLLEGDLAGTAAADHALGRRRRPTARQRAGYGRERRFQRLYGALFAARPGLTDLAGPRTVICRCEEVCRDEVDAAIAAGASTAPLVKSITRCGMGPCQGRVCLPIVEQLVTAATGRPPAPRTARAPLTPVDFAALREW